MATIDKKKYLRSSILDRLIDDEPHIQIETEKTRHQQLRELRNSVRRDLEKLLNTRFRVIGPPAEFTELQTSLLNFGLPDLATINIIDLNKRNAFTNDLERVLKTFEPRFKSVKITHQENMNNTDRTLRFRIDATLYADPVPEVVVFDSTLEPASRSVDVKESQYGR